VNKSLAGRLMVISKFPELETKEIKGDRMSVYYKGVAIIQQMRQNGSGYVPGHYIKLYTNAFNKDLDPRLMIRFHDYNDIQFEQLLRTAMDVVDKKL
jgi:hypothetical protein